MSLSDLASVGSLVSGVAVLISLIYLSLQVKQAERNQRALMQQGRANRVSDNIMRLCDADLASVWNRGCRGDSGLTVEQFEQFMLMCRSGFVSAEDSFLQHLSGQLDGTAFKSFTVTARGIFALPGTRAAWRLSSNQYGDEFEKFMEGIMRETPVQPEVDARQRWFDAIKSEKSGRPG
jgi:hypothetical protein